MTDKTDIPELRRFNFEIWPHEAYISEQYDGEYVLFADANQQLEAERQRADELRVGLESEISHSNRCIAKINTLEEELAALKGDQVPVADKCHPSMMESVTVPHNVIGTYEDASGGRSDKREMKGINYDVIAPGTMAMSGWGMREFLAPQKPVISKEKLCDWLEDNFDIDDSQRDAFAQCFAHHCNCIVKQDIE